MDDDDWVSINVSRDMSEPGLSASYDSIIRLYFISMRVANFLNVKTEHSIAN